jgi:hypothetical protein
MDYDFSFLITADGHRLLTDPGEQPKVEIQTDVLFLFPLRQYPYYKSLMSGVKPTAVLLCVALTLKNYFSICSY